MVPSEYMDLDIALSLKVSELVDLVEMAQVGVFETGDPEPEVLAEIREMLLLLVEEIDEEIVEI